MFLPAQLVQDLPRRARAFGRAALREGGVSAHSPTGIGRAEIGIERGQGACGARVPFGGSARKDFFEASEESLTGGAHGLWLRSATERRFLVAGVAGINRCSQPCAALIR
jgi:hypothetical protein